MKYCHRCHKLTTGEPVFCNYCGSSYGVKLCNRLHPNPRSANACSQCGSREFSTPQPKIPLVLRPFIGLLQVAPRLVGLGLFTGAVYLALHTVTHDPRFLRGIVCLLVLASVGALIWKLLPTWFKAFLKATFHVIALLSKTLVRLFFSKKRVGKGGRLETYFQ